MKRWSAGPWVLAVMALLESACGTARGGGGGGLLPDAGDPTDAPTSLDGAQPADVAAHEELPQAMDSGTAPDASMPTDVPTTPADVPTPPMDVPVVHTVTMASLADPAAPGHPSPGTVVTLADIDLVALSPRVLISGPGTTGTCAYALWVGTSAGGDFSGVEVFETVRVGPTDGGAAACFAPGVHGVIPEVIAIGDAIGTLRGRADDYCASGMVCPAGAARELNLDGGLGTLVLSGGSRAVPPPALVSITDINGTGATPAPRDLALQNTLVRVQGAVMQAAPTALNHDDMVITTTAGGPGIPVAVARYIGVGCQRTALAALPAGSSVGEVTGVLEFTFGAWLIQPRQASDLPAIVCGDGGTGG